MKTYLRMPSTKRLKPYLLILMGALLIYYLMGAYKEKELNELYSSRGNFLIAQKILSSKDNLEFSKKHLFKKEGIGFEDFLKNKAEEFFIRDLKIEKGKIEHIKQLEKSIYNIEGKAWHDSFIFKLIDATNTFSPGFAKIVFIEIDKFAKVTQQKPALKVKIVCEVYSVS